MSRGSLAPRQLASGWFKRGSGLRRRISQINGDRVFRPWRLAPGRSQEASALAQNYILAPLCSASGFEAVASCCLWADSGESHPKTWSRLSEISDLAKPDTKRTENCTLVQFQKGRSSRIFGSKSEGVQFGPPVPHEKLHEGCQYQVYIRRHWSCGQRSWDGIIYGILLQRPGS